MYEYKCTIRRVIDGDSLEADISLGFKLWYRATVRLIGINAPELKMKPYGPEAHAHLDALLAGKQSIIVHTTLNHEFEKYGRVLGSVVADGVNINQRMITDGYAAPLTY